VKKIYLGAGNDRKEGYTHVDILDLPGIDVVCNLALFPWPFEDESADEIIAIDVIEHMPTHTKDMESTYIKFIEEAYRILIPGGLFYIQTPGSKASFMWTDLTHVRPFEKDSFDFFDPSTAYGKSTGFYSNAKFHVKAEELENHNLRFWMTKI
jgi:predicted SAM-dependent methyltransferase